MTERGGMTLGSPGHDPAKAASTPTEAIPSAAGVVGSRGAQRPASLVCEPRTDCVDANVNRWYCMRGHDGAPDGVCPLPKCDRQGANAETNR